MAIKRPAPKNLAPEARAVLTNASAQQTGSASRVKSYDADFPVFEVPVNQKLLVYIPNHTVVAPDGSIGLRMDKFAAHPVLDGRSYADVRCSQGVVLEELGLNGACPLCDGISECWDLYNKEFVDVARSRGLDPTAAETQETLKNERIEMMNKMVIKKAEVWYTFPIVVIACEEKDGQLTVTPKKDEHGRISGKAMWYSIRERTYLDKWVGGFDSIDTVDGVAPNSPAGLWAILNFTYTPKSGAPDKMGSAKALKVTFKTMEGYGEWASYFDKLTEEWTPEKAQDVVVLDAIRDMDEMKNVADSLLKPVRDKLALYNLGAAPTAPAAGAIPQQSADAALAGFGIPQTDTPVGAPPAGLTGEMPNVGVQ